MLLRAWRRLDIPGATLVLAGEGPLRGADEPGVRFLGQVPRERLPVAYAAADAVVVPSLATRRFLEPWGLVCNEAMHAGTPVIASSAVGAAARRPGRARRDRPGRARRRRQGARASDRACCSATPSCGTGSAGSAATQVASYSYEAAADAFGQALRVVGAMRRRVTYRLARLAPSPTRHSRSAAAPAPERDAAVARGPRRLRSTRRAPPPRARSRATWPTPGSAPHRSGAARATAARAPPGRGR